MSRRFYVEADADGRPQFVTVKRSRSYHHHKGHCDYYRVNKDEWKAVVEQNRLLSEANEAFNVQNDALRTNLSISEAETYRLTHTVIPKLEGEIMALRCGHDIGDHRHHHRDSGKLRHRVSKLEKENKLLKDENTDLRWRVQELSKQLDQGTNRRVSESKNEVVYWKDQHRFWKTKFEDLQGRYSSLCTIVDTKVEKITVYEDLLRRHRLII